MNKIFKTIWNVTRQCVVVANENVHSQVKQKGGANKQKRTFNQVTDRVFSVRLLTCAVLATLSTGGLASITSDDHFDGNEIIPSGLPVNHYIFKSPEGYCILPDKYQNPMTIKDFAKVLEGVAVYVESGNKHTYGIKIGNQLNNQGYMRIKGGRDTNTTGLYTENLYNYGELVIGGGVYGKNIHVNQKTENNGTMRFTRGGENIFNGEFTSAGYLILDQQANVTFNNTVYAHSLVMDRYSQINHLPRLDIGQELSITAGTLKTSNLSIYGKADITSGSIVNSRIFESGSPSTIINICDKGTILYTLKGVNQGSINVTNDGSFEAGGAYNISDPFVNKGTITVNGGTFRGSDQANKFINEGNIIIETVKASHRDAVSVDGFITQTKAEAVFKAPLESLVNYKKGNSTNSDNQPLTSSCLALNASSQMVDVDLSAFATGELFVPKLSSEDAATFLPYLSGGTLIINESNYTLEAQQQIKDGLFAAGLGSQGEGSPSINIQFTGVGDKDFMVKENLFTVENTNKFVQSGYAGYVLPFKFISDKSEIVIGGKGADITESFGYKNISNVDKIVIRENKMLTLLDAGYYNYNLTDADIIVENGTLQLGTTASMDNMRAAGKIKNVELQNGSKLLSNSESHYISDYRIENIHGDGVINANAVLTIENLSGKFDINNNYRLTVNNAKDATINNINASVGKLTVVASNNVDIGNISNTGTTAKVKLEGINSFGAISNVGTTEIILAEGNNQTINTQNTISNNGILSITGQLEVMPNQQTGALIHNQDKDATMSLDQTTIYGGQVAGAIGIKNDIDAELSIQTAELFGGMGVAIENGGIFNLKHATLHASETSPIIKNLVGGQLTANQLHWSDTEKGGTSILNYGNLELQASPIYGQGIASQSTLVENDKFGAITLNVEQLTGTNAGSSNVIVNHGTLQGSISSLIGGTAIGASTIVSDGQINLGNGIQIEGGTAQEAYALINHGSAEIGSSNFVGGATDGAHASLNTGTLQFGSAPFSFNGSKSSCAHGLVNEGQLILQADSPSFSKDNLVTGGNGASYGILNAGQGHIKLSNRWLQVNGQGDVANTGFGILNEGMIEIQNAGLELNASASLNAIGGNGSIILNNGSLQGNLDAFMVYSTDRAPEVQVLNPDGQLGTIETQIFETGELNDGVGSLASFLTSALNGSGNNRIYITDTGWSQASVNAIKAAIQNAVGNSVEVIMNASSNPSKELTAYHDLVFDQTNVNKFLSNAKNVGTVFLTQDFISDSSSLSVGGNGLDALIDSVGFRKINGVNQITINDGKILTLLGDGSNVTSANITINDGDLVLGVEQQKAIQGGAIGNVIVTGNGALTVSKGNSIFDLTSLTLEDESRIDNHGHLRIKESFNLNGSTNEAEGVTNEGSIVAQDLVNSGSQSVSLHNSGVLSIANNIDNVNLYNDKILKAGHLNIGASNNLINTGTLLVNSINSVGAFLADQGAQLALGDTAVNQFLIDHPDVARSLIEAGETLPVEVTMAVYGIKHQLSSQGRNLSLQNSGYYMSNLGGELSSDEPQGTIVSTRKGGLDIDASRTENFGSRFDLGGHITGDHVVSSQSKNNLTIEIASQTVSNSASLTLLDSAYLTEGNAINIANESKLFVKDFDSQESGYRPGTFIVQGKVDLFGTMNSTEGAAVVVANEGIVNNHGTDYGSALIMQNNGEYHVDGGISQYQEVTLKGGVIHVSEGTFSVGVSGSTDKATAVLALNSELRNEGATIRVGNLINRNDFIPGDVYIGADGAFLVSTTSSNSTPLLTGSGSLHVEKGSKFIVADTSWGRHRITEGITLDDSILAKWSGDGLLNLTKHDAGLSISDGNLLLSIGKETVPSGPIDTSIQALSNRFALPDVINGLINVDAMVDRRDINSKDADISFIERILDSSFVGKLSDGSLDVAKAAGLWNSATQLSAVSGTDAYSLQATRHITSNVEEHLKSTNDASNDSAFWVTVNGRRDQAKKLESSGAMRGGYEADTYGMTFGMDVVRFNDWIVGASFHYEDGKLNSLGNYTKTDTDVNIIGIETYVQKRMGAASVMGYATYAKSRGDATQTFSDLKSNCYRVTGDLDGDIYTVGLRGDWLLAAGSNWSITPHAGLRYTHLSFDKYDVLINGEQAFAIKDHSADILDFPIGVSVEGSWRSGDWKLFPYADVSVISSVGDTETSVDVSATTFSGSDTYDFDLSTRTAVEGSFGLSAVNGDQTLNLNYRGLTGERGTQGHTLSFNYQLTF